MTRLRKRFLDCSQMDLAEAEQFGEELALMQRDVMFWLGDLARHAEARWPDTWQQAFPEWVSPGLLARCAGVCRAYPKEADRVHDCTYSQYMQVAGKPDRQKLLAEMEGHTTDETRKLRQDQANSQHREGGRFATAPPDPNAPPHVRWLLAVDVNYFLHRFWHSGAGIESAMSVAAWLQRTVERLKEKGLTDVACCFDSHTNHRKALTEAWEDKYKDRPLKEPELAQQLNLVRELLQKANFACVSVEGMEADDVMASYAKQFDGKITLLTQDKDCRQCLSSKCNILLDVTWSEDDTSGEHLPDYKWLTAKDHTEATGIPPQRWIDYQCIMGDNCDGIRGVEGIGQKGAADLVKQYGTVEGVIAAAKIDAPSITPKKREAIKAFEAKLEVTRRLVTLVDNLTVPESTRI